MAQEKKKMNSTIMIALIFSVSILAAIVTIKLTPRPTPEQSRKLMEANKAMTEKMKNNSENLWKNFDK